MLARRRACYERRPVRRFTQASALALALSLASAALAPVARATVVERVVAVIGEHAILLSDMRRRARPYLVDVARRYPSAAQQAAAESELYKQLLEKMVDERLEQQAADKAHLTISADEIDAGIKNVAGAQGLSVEQLVAEASKTGLSPQEYRDEVRRQILEGKLLQLRVKSRVRVTDEDVKAAYARVVRNERRRLGYRAAWIVVRPAAGATAAQKAEREQLAARIARTAQSGRDALGNAIAFETLARSFSDDATTHAAGGDLGRREPGELAASLEDELAKLDVGAVSGPVRYKDGLVILKLVERDPSQVPAFPEVKDEVSQRAYGEQMDKARRQWLEELRRGVYVDVRL